MWTMKCFVWSILALLYPASSHPDRVEQYKPYEDKLDTRGIDFPMKISSISKFERQNPTISVNVFGIDESEENSDDQNIIFPLRITTYKEREYHVNLLFQSLQIIRASSKICLL